jgi:L-amino acid N-acyltransferase YncA
MTGCTIRAATPDGADTTAVARIYGHFVRTSTATFEVDPPDATEIARRIASIQQLGLPYLVAEAGGSGVSGGSIVGYAYATQFRPRPAYRHTVEDSVYIDPAWAGRGIGRQLLTALIEQSTRAGARQMIGAIGGDNPPSVALHTALGFEHAGILTSVGFKFGQWLDLTLMQRPL